LNGSANMYTAGSDDLDHVSYIEYWDLNRVYDAGNNATNYVTLYWQDQNSSGIANSSELRVGVLNGSNLWESFGQGAMSYGSSGDITTATAVSNFGSMTFGSTGGGNPLPIELLSFKAEAEGQVVELAWSTASEMNCDFFTVQRSSDGVNFEAVVDVDARGNTVSRTDYRATDYDPLPGTSYYRLAQTDVDGTSVASEIVTVVRTQESVTPTQASVFPNPAVDDWLSVRLHHMEESVVRLTDGLGRILGQEVNQGDVLTIFSMSGLPSGVYFVVINGSAGAETIKVIRP
jgi:hypothetical protein